ncbi:efflux RND transporter periplasmic adaptor subunit [uncultured Hymenobacter sp.]|uniref:efflux RND transporter periplasmic adaptor subunit n=1 Tax=uncultured Hymenobacter sp. TaxID=170016 RepID=UPI0035CBA6EE
MNSLPPLLLLNLLLLLGLAACGPKAPADAEAEAPKPRALVTVEAVRADTVRDVLRLSAVSAYPAKDVLRATTTGYVLAPTPLPGQNVQAGQTVFRVQTKESRVLHLDQLTGDPRLRFSGIIAVKSGRAGVLSTVDKLAGDYVQDGEQLGMVYDRARFGFVLDVPVTQLRFVRVGQACRIYLPDGRTLPGRVEQVLATADVAIQTQRYTVRVLGRVPDLPENLAVQVGLDRTAPHLAPTVPRGAVLTDETQTQFWVMRLLNDSTAVKVPIKRGPEQGGRIQIDSPAFRPQDRILVSGNYGLDDTAAVRVTK